MPRNTRVLIASVPTGPLGPEHFAVEEAPTPECPEGEVLCRTLALTIGAGQRAGLQGSASYAGAPSPASSWAAPARLVEASNSPDFSAGDTVVGPTGWQEYSSRRPALRGVPPGSIRRTTSACSAPTA